MTDFFWFYDFFVFKTKQDYTFLFWKFGLLTCFSFVLDHLEQEQNVLIIETAIIFNSNVFAVLQRSFFLNQTKSIVLKIPKSVSRSTTSLSFYVLFAKLILQQKSISN